MPLTSSSTNTRFPRFSNPFAHYAHIAGNALVAVCHWGFDQIMRYTDPFILGRSKAMDQFHLSTEIFVKFFRLGIGGNAFLMGAPLAMIGQLIKVPTAYFWKEDFEYYHNPGNTIWIDKKNIKIWTWNLAAMHSGLRRYNGMRPNEPRLNEIVKYLKNKNDDILCLQEVFTESATQILIEGLKKQYPHIVHNVGKNVIGINSGLMLLSKFPIEHLEFETFTSRTGFNQLSQKGVLGAIVTTPSNKKIVITNAHLDAGGDTAGNSDALGSKLLQLEQVFSMRDRLENLAETFNENIISVFAADANLNSKKLMANQHEPVIQTLLTQYAINPAEDRKTSLQNRILTRQQANKDNFNNSKSGGDLIKARVAYTPHDAQAVSIATHRDTLDNSDHFPSTLTL